MMALVPNPHAHYRSVLGAFYTIAATEKPRALFKGIGVVAMGAGPAHAIYFSAYEYSKKFFSRYSNGVVAQGMRLKENATTVSPLCFFRSCRCNCITYTRWFHEPC